MNKIYHFLHARLWTVFTCLVILVFLMALWLVTPSTILFRPTSWTYDPAAGTVTFARLVNSDAPVTVTWSHIVYAPSGKSCADGGTRPYDNRVKVEIIPITGDLKRCLDQPDHIAVLSWSPRLWGIIPLRPYTMTIPADAQIPVLR